MRITIKKPLYETKDGLVVGVYDRRIENAIFKREPIVISCQGIEQAFSPEWIKRTCPVIEKVFLRPDEPMKLYKVFLKRDNELRELAKLGIFG